jgi:hypothetical protein
VTWAAKVRPLDLSIAQAPRLALPSMLQLHDSSAWVISPLVTETAVRLQDAVVVSEHVVGNRSRVGVLQIRVEVELDDPVLDRLRDLHRRRPASAVEDEVERGV